MHTLKLTAAFSFVCHLEKYFLSIQKIIQYIPVPKLFWLCAFLHYTFEVTEHQLSSSACSYSMWPWAALLFC